MQNIRIKICGITSVYDSRLVCSFPIHAIGLNFVKRSKRKINLKTAREILDKLPPLVEPILIFEDEKISEVMYICDTLAVSSVQLHGLEPVSYCSDLKRFNKRLKIIKAFPTKEASVSLLNAYRRVCSCFLLDSYDRKGLMGGTGKPSDWNIAQEIVSKSRLPIILAGGLNPYNINSAIKRVKPYAVDVNSGVESRIGKKDKSMMERLFEELNS
ncbi:MAG: phosphoribosylanthranilate isomerase [Candidatus Melainabacteria bacterium]|nr:phosphoribosylanthranilate isomerase [Candidatus Melainabacteria bacterium]